ncbi:MAG: hypothetical protein GY770_01550 [Aestuariibacter sp.]|nr:hypothetical protein [Aestuariibacter sp.]
MIVVYIRRNARWLLRAMVLVSELNAPISTSFNANFGTNQSACGVGLSGSGTIGEVTAAGEIVFLVGKEDFTYEVESFQLYEGATF